MFIKRSHSEIFKRPLWLPNFYVNEDVACDHCAQGYRDESVVTVLKVVNYQTLKLKNIILNQDEAYVNDCWNYTTCIFIVSNAGNTI